MKIIRNNNAENIVINSEQKFRLDLGWQENLVDFETEVLESIINPTLNYETVRYIHKEYQGSIGPQTDIWFSFYFVGSNGYYMQDYNAPSSDISHRENELMLKQATESFFRLEFYKTPRVLDENENVIGFEEPTRQNRKLVFAKNLALPLGEKYLYKDPTGYTEFYIHVPVFQGSNYRNKENMYLFWFEDESVIDDTTYFGNGSGNTFFMSAKFMDAKTASIVDFTNSGFTTGHTINDANDMYYQVDFNHLNRTYSIAKYTGGTAVFNANRALNERIGWNTGHTNFNPIKFFERGGGGIGIAPTATPLPTSTPTPTATPIPSVVASVCYTITSGYMPVTGAAGSSAQGTITVTGGNVNIWTMYNSGGLSNGEVIWSATINSTSIFGDFMVLTYGQPGYTTSGGSTGNGYVTLSPGTYSLSLLKSDNYSSGNGITNIMWAQSSITNPNVSTYAAICII
jgi:hypothetical protein